MAGGRQCILDPLPLNDGRPATVWRPMLAEAERAFLAIAHQPLSGPAA
jgi:hypothetical protein